MSLSDDKLVDIWMNQSDLMWRTISLTPLIVVSIMVAWYSVYVSQDVFLQRMTLGFGVVVLLVQFLVIKRMAQYLDAYKSMLSEQMAEVKSAAFGLSGSVLARTIPLVICFAFVVLFIKSFF